MDDVSYVIQELNNIINELEDIKSSLYGFQGINSEKCADAIDNQISKYYTARSRLQSIDTSKVSE